MKKYPLNKVTHYNRYRDYIEGLAQQYQDKPAISWFTRKSEEKGVSFVLWQYMGGGNGLRK